MTLARGHTGARRWPRGGVIAALIAIAVAAVAIPLALVLWGPRAVPQHLPPVVMPRRVAPPTELPPVDPVSYQDLSPADARAYNATIPFVTGAIPAARPFHIAGTPDSIARATDCLAAAVLYEAGDDSLGMKAVAQVVLNRVRHPAFPKTVCGVVFQGSDRTTGCQFTFTCDGALGHRWSDAAWARARDVAKAALDGAVFKPVGYATHYHTDWVVPYWSDSLDKLAAVHTHLFYRWTGWWGTPAAFGRQVDPEEPVIAKLALWSDAHKLGSAMDQADAAIAEAAAAAAGTPIATATDPNSFVMTLSKKLTPDAFPVYADKVCGDRPYCKLMAWSDAKLTPASPTLDPRQIATMSFSYLRDRAHSYEKALWNCREFKRDDPTQCMKAQILVPQPRIAAETATPSAVAPGAVPASATLKAVPDGLTGVHRKGDPTTTTSPPVVPTTATPSRAGTPAKAGTQDDQAQRSRP